MKLDRNINANGRGKYALLKLRNLRAGDTSVDAALRTLDEAGILDWGSTPETEFFVMRLKDKYARIPLHAYSDEAFRDGEKEYAAEVGAMAMRAGTHSPFCKKPD